MSDQLDFTDFLKKDDPPPSETPQESPVVDQSSPEAPAEVQTAEVEAVDESVELDVQKAVVESLAADKAECDETIVNLRRDNYRLASEIAVLKQKLAEQSAALAKVGDVLATNSETPGSNKVALIDREIELPDRFPGETYDHVLEALQEARDLAEKEGRNRRAQILESVLVANEPSGNLKKKRIELEKLFNDNQNILSGPVIAELERLEIPYKKGEDYLLPGEIIKRVY